MSSFDDERDAAAPFRGQYQGGSRRPFPFDALDEVGELAASQRLDADSLGRPSRVGHGDDVRSQRVGSRQLVGLVGRDEADPVWPLDLGEERGEGARAASA